MLIEALNKDGRIVAKYSTPVEYTDAKHAEHLTWPTKMDDFMTIAQNWSEASGLRGHMYWAGCVLVFLFGFARVAPFFSLVL